MEVLEQGIGTLIQIPDIEMFREWNHTQKPRGLVNKLMNEQEAIERFVYDGCYVSTDLYGSVRCPMSLVREIVRQEKKKLRVAGQGGLEFDMWLAAGLIEAMDVAYIGLEANGTSKVFRRAMERGQIKYIAEWSNASLVWRLKAAAMGVSFLPTNVMLGTDTFKHSAAKVVKDPFTDKKICLVPALIPDVGLIHAHYADIYGNAQIKGISGYAFELARASKRLIVSAEEIIDTTQICRDSDRTIIPHYLVDAVVHAPFGSHPGDMAYRYVRDEGEIYAWMEASQTTKGAATYLDQFVYDVPDHAAYLGLIGKARLSRLRQKVQEF